MNVLALISTCDTPDLLAVCLASLRRFAPTVSLAILNNGGTSTGERREFKPQHSEQGARAHAAGIEWARRDGLHEEYDIIILLDSDVCVTSEAWLPRLVEGMPTIRVAGGYRHRGEAYQLIMNGIHMIHASCLAMTAETFAQIKSFHGENDGICDTAYQASLFEPKRLLPFRVPLHGPLYPHLPVGEFFDPNDSEGRTLWSHLGRGTSWYGRDTRWQWVKACISPRAAKILRWQAVRQAWVKRSWEILDERY